MFGPFLLLIILTAVNAVFASAEIAVISVSESRLKMLRDEGSRAASRLLALTEQPSRFLSTIQVAITLAGQLSSAFAAENFAGPVTSALLAAGVPIPENILRTISLLLITVVLAYFNLIFGELVPKRVAMKRAESLSLALSGLLYFVAKCFAPLVFLLSVSTNGVLRLMGLNPEEDDEAISEEEIRMLLAQGNAQGVIKQRENEIIQNLFEFDDITADQLCTHRVDLLMLDTTDFDAWADTIRDSHFTHYPVYTEEKDNIIGILSAKKYFRLGDCSSLQAVLNGAVAKPLFLPRTMKADRVFQALQNAHQGLAMLVDEYGGLYGMVTLHDLLEALVGDLDDGHGPQEVDIRRLNETTWRIDGRADLAEVNRALDAKLPCEEHDTLNGLLYELAGRIPANGEHFSCEGYGLHFDVPEVRGHRVVYALVRPLPPETPADGADDGEKADKEKKERAQ